MAGAGARRQRRAAGGSGGDGLRAARHEARPQARQVRPLGQRMEGQHAFGVGAGGMGHLKDAGRRGAAPDLGIAFVGEDAEIMPLGQRQQVGPVVARRRPRPADWRASRVGDGRAVQHVARQGAIVGQKIRSRRWRAHRQARPPSRGPRRHRPDRRGWASAPRGAGLPLVSGHSATAALNSPSRVPFSTISRSCGHRDAIAPRDPARDGQKQVGRAVIGRVDAKARQGLRQHRDDEIGHRVARFADGHGHRLAARGWASSSFRRRGNAYSGRVENRSGKSISASGSGVVAPRVCERIAARCVAVQKNAVRSLVWARPLWHLSQAGDEGRGSAPDPGVFLPR
jgi:hypothetical protein